MDILKTEVFFVEYRTNRKLRKKSVILCSMYRGVLPRSIIGDYLRTYGSQHSLYSITWKSYCSMLGSCKASGPVIQIIQLTRLYSLASTYRKWCVQVWSGASPPTCFSDQSILVSYCWQLLSQPSCKLGEGCPCPDQCDHSEVITTLDTQGKFGIYHMSPCN